MSVRNLILEKKRKLEDEIKASMNKFMDETGLIIESIVANSTNVGALPYNVPEERETTLKRKTLMETLDIRVIL